MEYQTLRGRISKLSKKCRKAIRLYSNMGRAGSPASNELSEAQIEEWKNINTELLRELSTMIESLGSSELALEVYALRDRFYSCWRMVETELHSKQKSLIAAAENADFVRAALLGRELVALKARVQASAAAHHELQEIIDGSKLAKPTIKLSQESIISETQAVEPEKEVVCAKVIPLRRLS